MANGIEIFPSPELTSPITFADITGADADLATFALPANTTISTFTAGALDETTVGAFLTALGIDADVATLSVPASTTISSFVAGALDETTIAAFLTALGLDADLATLALPASTTISAFGASLVDDANAAAALTTLGLDADLATFALPASTTISAYGATLVDDADAATARTTLGLGTAATSASTDFQPIDADLTTIAGLTATTDNFMIAASSAWASRTPTQARTSLGLATGDSPQFTAINVGDASDTTLARSGAGELTVEGNRIFRVGGADVPIADGGTAASTAATAFNNLSPMTTKGDVIYGGTSGAGTRLAPNPYGGALMVDADSVPAWDNPASPADYFGAATVSAFASYDRGNFASAASGALGSGSSRAQRVFLPRGFTAGSIAFLSVGATVTPTHQWFALYDEAGGLLAVTSDNTNTAWGANTLRNLNLDSSYKVPLSAWYYVLIVVTAATGPTLMSITGLDTTLRDRGYQVCVNCNTGLTTPASAPSTLTFGATSTLQMYCEVR